LHILAISGLHVGIIYFALKVILKILRVGRNLSVILTVIFLMGFAIMTGARPSILRAATMFSILAFTGIRGRKTGIFNLIGLSCLIILLANPNQVFNTGFILSYAAVLSIVTIPPLLSRAFPAGTKHFLLKSLLVSLAANIGLMPLIAYYFGLVSPIAVIANLIVVPLLIVIMGSGLLFMTLGLLSGFLGLLFSGSVWIWLVALVNSVRVLREAPFAYFEVRPPHIWMIALYYIGIGAVIVIARAHVARSNLKV
jgi:competence protein ComEC